MTLARNDTLSLFGKISKPYRVTKTPDSKLYEFYRIDSKERTGFEGRKDIKTELAMIDILDSGKEFILTYCPLDRNNEITIKLPIKDLAKAVEDLIKAGF
jgi:hypothetical protein